MTNQTCSIEGCNGKGRICRGWCWAHYMRWLTTGDTGSPEIIRRERGRVCSVAGCGRKHSGRGYCLVHLNRFLKDGDPGPAEIEPRQPDALCSVEGCVQTIRRGGRGWCSKHHQRWRKTGAPDTPLLEHHPKWIGDAAGYDTIHQRLRHQRGKASDHACVRCGEPARNWSYDYAAPDEKLDETGKPYSTDLSHYQPMCTTCHRRFDVVNQRKRKSP